MLRQCPQAHVVDDEQIGFDVAAQDAVALRERVLGEEVSHEVEDRAVAHHEALLDRFVTDLLRQVSFADAGRSDEEDIGFRPDKVTGRQFVDLFAGDRGVEAPIKLVERLEPVEVGDFHPALDLALLADVDFVLQDEGQKLFGREPIGRGFLQPHGQGLTQPGEPELMQELMELVHGSIW